MFTENVIELKAKRTQTMDVTGYEVGICQRCHRKISLMKLHQHPMSIYCSYCEGELAVRRMEVHSGPIDLCAMAV